MLGRLISHPELRTVHGQPRHDRTVGSLHTVDLDGSEGRLVELHGARALSNRQHRRDRTGDGSPRAWSCSHRFVPHLDRRCSRTEALTAATPSQTKSASTRACVRANGGSDWVGAATNNTGIRLNSCATRTNTFRYVARTTPTA